MSEGVYSIAMVLCMVANRDRPKPLMNKSPMDRIYTLLQENRIITTRILTEPIKNHNPYLLMFLVKLISKAPIACPVP